MGLTQYGKYVLRQQVLDDGIRLSPRYGEWNLAEMKALPDTESDMAGILLLPKPGKS
jgi:hypothetical protein